METAFETVYNERNQIGQSMLDLDALCRRIGYVGPLGPDLETLTALQRAFVLSVPFENLDILLGRPLRLEVPWLFHKIVVERRGGYCYELNGLFAAALEAIGFRVVRLGVSLRSQVTGEWTSPHAHLAMLVELEAAFLVDVGLNDVMRAPLRLQDDLAQSDGWAEYRLCREGPGTWRLALRDPGLPWEERYRFEEVPRLLEEFIPASDRLQVSPESPFRRDTLCGLARPDGRVTVTGQRVVEVDRAGRRETTLFDRAALVRALKEHIGLDLLAIAQALGSTAAQ